MIIELPFKTPTINHLYGQRGKFKYMKPEAKKMREEIKEIISLLPRDDWMDEPKELSISVSVFEDWYTKKGTVKRKDVANREKFLIDSVFEALGIDDKFIFHQSMDKMQSKDEKVIIQIEEMNIL